MLEALDGFLIAISRQGQVLYVSDNVMAVLGYSEKSLVGGSFYNFIHESERADVFKVLTSCALSMEKEGKKDRPKVDRVKKEPGQNNQNQPNGQQINTNRQQLSQQISQIPQQILQQIQNQHQLQSRQIGRKSPFSVQNSNNDRNSPVLAANNDNNTLTSHNNNNALTSPHSNTKLVRCCCCAKSEYCCRY
jgi:PAS domain S-box-containing protein